MSKRYSTNLPKNPKKIPMPLVKPVKTNYIYLVWNQDTSIDDEVLLEVFSNEQNAEDYADKIENENFTYCRVEQKKLK